MVRVLFVKHFIFSLSIIILSGCEIAHVDGNSGSMTCNIFDENRDEIILCPQLENVKLPIGNIRKNRVLTIWFLSTENRIATEFKQSSSQRSILTVSPLVVTENNLSYISVTPKIVGTTILMIGDINLTLTVVNQII